MVNPWVEWQRLMRAGTMMSETFLASQEVVGHRGKTIEGAISNPLTADHAELSRMVTEKGMAFGTAGASLARDWWRMQGEIGAQAIAIGQMMMGRVPSARATHAMLSRGQRLGSAALASSNRAMRPIHATATANARRLKKKR